VRNVQLVEKTVVKKGEENQGNIGKKKCRSKVKDFYSN